MNDTSAAADRKPWEQLIALAEAGDEPALDIYLSSLSSTDQAYAIAHLDDDEVEPARVACRLKAFQRY